MRIAVATADGQNVDEHFGIARSFQVYDIEAVLAGRIGEYAYDDLMGNGIIPYEVSSNIDRAIGSYVNYRRIARGND